MASPPLRSGRVSKPPSRYESVGVLHVERIVESKAKLEQSGLSDLSGDERRQREANKAYAGLMKDLGLIRLVLDPTGGHSRELPLSKTQQAQRAK
jgi:hypothetical protein